MRASQWFRLSILLSCTTLLLCSGCATMGGGTQGVVLSAKNKVAPALVHIRPVKEVYAQGKRQEVVAIGSGFIVSPDGYVVTNEHVAGESKYVQCVLSDKSEVDAEVIGVDPLTDIAVLKLPDQKPLPYVRFGDSDKLEAGQTVMALGSPHGLARSVSLGIVSVVDRHLGEQTARQAPYNNWIQTDAAINQGNSGGPLVDLRGRVIGVNARVLLGAENIGFAIPSNVAKGVMEEIIANGRVIRSSAGITLQEMRAKTDDPNVMGVVIADVDPLSPAKAAGFYPGDVLIAVAGKPVHARFEEDLPAVRKLIADLPVGEPAVFTILRGDDTLDISLSPEEQRNTQGTQDELTEWGFTVSELTPEFVRQAQLDVHKGVVVSGVQVGGIASNAGLRRGDILLKSDETIIENLAHFKELYNSAIDSNQKLVMLWVKRGALTRFVLVKQTPVTESEVTAEPEVSEVGGTEVE